jgi:hypothetical protein
MVPGIANHVAEMSHSILGVIHGDSITHLAVFFKSVVQMTRHCDMLTNITTKNRVDGEDSKAVAVPIWYAIENFPWYSVARNAMKRVLEYSFITYDYAPIRHTSVNLTFRLPVLSSISSVILTCTFSNNSTFLFTSPLTLST